MVQFSPEDLEELNELQNLEFLPAVVDGERDPDNLYLPEDVYRAGRAPGFASRVPVIDITPLRLASASVVAVLDLLGVPEEPNTRVVVDHLRHCMSNVTAPSDLTYTILNERVEKADDLSAIDELKGSAFIYDAELKRFLRSDQVFWLQPAIRELLVYSEQSHGYSRAALLPARCTQSAGPLQLRQIDARDRGAA